MKCNSRTMLATALALGLATVVAYLALPAAKAFILASAPVLIALVCPVSMLFMMKTMNAGKKDQDSRTEERTSAPRIASVGSDQA